MRWNLDPSHSTAEFIVRHMMITNVRGRFGVLAGTVDFDPERPESATIEVTAQAASIQTHDATRDAHLRGADFFDVEKHPHLEFRSKKVVRKGQGFAATGDLSMRGVSREVTFDIEGPTAPGKDPWGQTRIGASATATVRRKDWGLVWNTPLEAGGVLVSDEVKLELHVSLIAAKTA